MGEVVLRQRLADAGIEAEVDSVGVSAEESGHPIDSRARAVLSRAGYDIHPHCARQVTARDLTDSSLVLAMTVGHAASLRALAEEAGVDVGKIHLWREFEQDSPLGIAPGGVFGTGGALADGPARSRGYSNFYSSDGPHDVPDPWYGSASGFEDTLATIEAGADGIIEAIEDNQI